MPSERYQMGVKGRNDHNKNLNTISDHRDRDEMLDLEKVVVK